MDMNQHNMKSTMKRKELRVEKFLGFDCFGGVIPDKSSICRFRHLLESHGLSQKILRTVNRHLGDHGMVLKEGTILDTTLLQAPVSKKNESKERDPKISSTLRAKVEHPFRVIKHLWGHYKLRPDSGKNGKKRYKTLHAIKIDRVLLKTLHPSFCASFRLALAFDNKLTLINAGDTGKNRN